MPVRFFLALATALLAPFGAAEELGGVEREVVADERVPGSLAPTDVGSSGPGPSDHRSDRRAESGPAPPLSGRGPAPSPFPARTRVFRVSSQEPLHLACLRRLARCGHLSGWLDLPPPARS